MSPIALPADARPAVSIVVLVTADAARAEACFEAIAAYGREAGPAEVIVMANAPEADMCTLLEPGLAGAHIVWADEDVGTARGWNAAFALAQGPRVLLLHEDARLRPGALAALAAALDADPEIAVAGPRLFEPAAGMERFGWVLWGDGRPTTLDAVNAPGVEQRGDPFDVDCVSSAAMLIDRAAWESCGGFDERYFPAVGVDQDLCVAMRAAGRRVVCVPAAEVVHDTGAMVRPAGDAEHSAVMRHFLSLRSAGALASKWPERLGLHESRPEDVPFAAPPPELVLAALDAVGKRPAGGAPRRSQPPKSAVQSDGRLIVDPAVQGEARALREAVRKEFLAWLVERDGVLHEEIRWRDATIAELHEQAGEAYKEILHLRALRDRDDPAVPSRRERFRARHPVSPRTHAIAAVGALVFLTLIVVTGAGVRLTGSGLGCPEWPRCTDQSLTPQEGHAFIEFGNRMMTTPTALFSGLAFLFAWLRVPYRRDFTLFGAALLIGVLMQAVLGGITVLTGLNPVIVMGHFLLSMVTVTLAVILLWRVHRDARGAPEHPERDRRLVYVVRGLFGFGAAVVFLGTAVTASGPHAGGEGTNDDVERLAIFGTSTFRDLIAVHARLAAAFGACVVLVFLYAWRRRAGRELLLPLGAVGVVVGLTGLIGHLQYHVYAYPAGLVWVHVSLVALLWGTLSWAVVAAGRPAPAPVGAAGEAIRAPA